MSEIELTRPRGEYAAPLPGGMTAVASCSNGGPPTTSIVVDPCMTDLFVARFDGAVPRVDVAGGTVHIRHARARRNRGRIALTGRVPWSVEIRGGAARLRAELASADDVRRSRSAAAPATSTWICPCPTGRVPIRFGGGVSQLSVLRPKGVPVRLTIGGGAARIALDEQRFGGVGRADRAAQRFRRRRPGSATTSTSAAAPTRSSSPPADAY